jgi:hypothetical protein
VDFSLNSSSHAVIVNLVANTTTKTGLKVRANLDKRSCPTGQKITNEEIAQLNLHPADFHGEDWNYTLKPRKKIR